MHIVNLTPFKHLRLLKSDRRGLEFGVVIVKATYVFDDEGHCILSDEQEMPNAEERSFDQTKASSLRQPSDHVGYKPSTDVILNAVAYAPEGKPAKSWSVGIEIIDAQGVTLRRILRITGPRWWVPKWRRTLTEEEKCEWQKYRHLFEGWELSEAEPITHLPIRYEYAYGGTVTKGADKEGHRLIEACEYNPVGIGFIDKDWTDHTMPQPAPQIEYADEPITDPYQHYRPAGFGAIHRSWLPRRPLGGTYDQYWFDHIWPKWPSDYDFRFNNAAAGLCGYGFLQLPIRLQLVNLHPKLRHRFITFDAVDLMATYQDASESYFSFIPQLDTLYLDLAEEEAFEHFSCLVWRLIYHPDKTEAITVQRSKALLAGIVESAPHPNECGRHSVALEKRLEREDG